MCKFITFMFIIGLRGTDFITIKNQTDLTVGISLYTTSAMSRSHTFTQMKCQLNYTLRWQWSCRPILYIVCISPANLSTVGIIYCIGCVKTVAVILRMRIRSDREKFSVAVTVCECAKMARWKRLFENSSYYCKFVQDDQGYHNVKDIQTVGNMS